MVCKRVGYIILYIFIFFSWNSWRLNIYASSSGVLNLGKGGDVEGG